MERVILPGERSGAVRAPSSKSHAHRLLICAALGTEPVDIMCDDLSNDICATIDCLNELCAEIHIEGTIIHIRPVAVKPGRRVLHCRESGSTLRFLIPVCGALGADVQFCMEGRLPQRPLYPLDRVLQEHGMVLTLDNDLLYCSGKLIPGSYEISGKVSSQYISGLLFALPLLSGNSSLSITEGLESAAYVDITESCIQQARIIFEKKELHYEIPGVQRYSLPSQTVVEGDCSNAAFFLALGALSSTGLRLKGFPLNTKQGDREILSVLARFGAIIEENAGEVYIRRGTLRGITIDAAPIPDLIPVLSVVAATAEGETRIINAARLRLKESDRLQSTAALIAGLGGSIEELPEGLIIHGIEQLSGGTADACNDHRIAMSAAVAAAVSTSAVKICGTECTNKSYPKFWDVFQQLERRAT